MIEGILLPVEVSKISSRVDGSVNISLDTPEISAVKAGELFSLRKKQAFCYLKTVTVTANEQKIINDLEPELPQGKSPSQRLRSALYVAWKQNPEGYDDANLYYISKMEKFIEHVKSKLEPR